MELIEGIENISKPFKNAVVSIGNFDGVHKGHRVLFKETIEKAAEIDGTSVLITFEPHPIRVLKKGNNPPLITRYKQKIGLIKDTGIDVLICVKFDPQFASLSASEFVEDFLYKRIGMRAIVVGKDYAFGKNRQGNIDSLEVFAQKLGFEVIVKDWVYFPENETERVSSTRIRNLVTDGRLDHVKAMMGRHYQLKGKVSKGRDRGGKLLGFPTANINILDELCPMTGVYAVTVEHEGTVYKGVANIGYSPTFDDHKFTIEIHILDFNKDIYNQNIKVNFIKRLRSEKKFDNIDALSEQIKKDITEAKQILSNE